MPIAPTPTDSVAWSTYRLLFQPYPYLEELRARYGETFKMTVFGAETTLFSNPEHVRDVFTDDGSELEGGRFNHQTLAPLLGDRSVLMVDGASHRRKRKLLLPPFMGERMQAYGRTMLDVSDDQIDDMPHGTPFSFHTPMQEITLRVIIETIFGFTGAAADEMGRNMKRLLELGTWPPLLIPAMRFDLGKFSPYGRFRLAVEKSDRLLHEHIEAKRRGARGPDVLSVLLSAKDDEGQGMTNEELRDELVTLLVAGHETTATALTWTMRWLLENPKTMRELEEDLAALGPDPKPDAIAKAPFLDAVVREGLRLVPVIPLVGRMLNADRTIGGYELKKGDALVCSIYLAQRRAEAYPNPDQFDPKRFLGKKMTPQEFFPFGGGVRRCIGMQFALYEMKMVLARLVMRGSFELDPTAKRGMERRSITITPTAGLRVILKRRALRPGLQPTRVASA